MTEKIKIADLPEFDITEHLDSDQVIAEYLLLAGGNKTSPVGHMPNARRGSGKKKTLLLFPPLRTVHDSFPSYGSSLLSPFWEPVSLSVNLGCVFVYDDLDAP